MLEKSRRSCQIQSRKRVQFIHESVREYVMTASAWRTIWQNINGYFEGDSHDRLKTSCLSYLSS